MLLLQVHVYTYRYIIIVSYIVVSIVAITCRLHWWIYKREGGGKGRKRGSEGEEGGRAFACNMIASTNLCLLTYQIAMILVAEICTLTHPSF